MRDAPAQRQLGRRPLGPLDAIQDNWKRGTGILNNELYVSMQVWHHQTCMRDPDTTKRQTCLPDGAFTTAPVTRHDIAGRPVPTTWRVELPARGLDITVTAQSPDA